MQCLLLKRDEIIGYWGDILPITHSFYEGSDGRYTPDMILKKVLSGDFLVWIVVELEVVKAVIMARVIEYPTMKELSIIMGVGTDYKEWTELVINNITAYAKDKGCTKFSAITRLGWKPIFSQLGFKNTHIILEKSI